MNELKTVDEKIDMLEFALVANKEHFVDCPVEHTFVPGMYIRKIFMPKGENGIDNYITSLIHNTNHPYFVMSGEVMVYSENDGEQILRGGDWGITRPHTRRVLKIIENTIWVTCHPTDIQPENNSKEAVEKAVNLIGEKIIEKHENPLLDGVVKNNYITN